MSLSLSRLLPDKFTLALVGTVVLATLLPAQGQVSEAFDGLTIGAIALLFFLHGAKLSREAILAGALHWRLHLLIFSLTFLLFPALGLALKPVLAPLVTPELYLGVLFMCALPATVQSAIAFTSIARGNIPAAVCSASASSLLGIFITPFLVQLLLEVHGDTGSTLDAIQKIVLQLLVPFVVGHLARRWIGEWVDRNKAWLRYVDQMSILLVVYTAFGRAVLEGLWQAVPGSALLGLFVICVVILALVLGISVWLARLLGFNKEDEITIVFGGSKKSLATGVPMANVLFAAGTVGSVLLPIMIFHQLQLMVCVVIANRYARRTGKT
ncbi:bile acid:sodium symporter family protein [Alcanivorax quisquiliarum]|uniref:Bile acid:sodium symporter n=1 Tax=Alcanivorax quisquiliarum TaxID=2933565 RepID=A0ABT0E8R3_9GAMM|nr:bile acid:sodium symporter family protein [Alcanivorax quisquiliarum]MCK0538224.1 bile acid:sodium symporter [Alcanivorax quisquiliarum]